MHEGMPKKRTFAVKIFESIWQIKTQNKTKDLKTSKKL